MNKNKDIAFSIKNMCDRLSLAYIHGYTKINNAHANKRLAQISDRQLRNVTGHYSIPLNVL